MWIINALTLVFVTAKLFGVIDWSWWLVVSPTLIHVVLWIIVVTTFAYLGSRK